MRVKQAKLGVSVTVANQTESFWDNYHNRCILDWDKGILTITACGRQEGSKLFTIMVPATNIAYLVPFSDGDVPFEPVMPPVPKADKPKG